MCHSLDPEVQCLSLGPYAAYLSPFKVESQRVFIWQPRDDKKTDVCTVFYFIKLLATAHHHCNESGDHYSTLFIKNVLHANQSHSESELTPRSYMWYTLSENFVSSFQSRTSYDTSPHISKMFEINSAVRLKLTASYTNPRMCTRILNRHNVPNKKCTVGSMLSSLCISPLKVDKTLHTFLSL